MKLYPGVVWKLEAEIPELYEEAGFICELPVVCTIGGSVLRAKGIMGTT